jgi:hypothetical protein
MYIATWPFGEGKIQKLKERTGIEIKNLDDFIKKMFFPTTRNWKKSAPSPKKPGKWITLPENYWLLKLIDYLKTNNLLKV